MHFQILGSSRYGRQVFVLEKPGCALSMLGHVPQVLRVVCVGIHMVGCGTIEWGGNTEEV